MAEADGGSLCWHLHRMMRPSLGEPGPIGATVVQSTDAGPLDSQRRPPRASPARLGVNPPRVSRVRGVSAANAVHLP